MKCIKNPCIHCENYMADGDCGVYGLNGISSICAGEKTVFRNKMMKILRNWRNAYCKK